MKDTEELKQNLEEECETCEAYKHETFANMKGFNCPLCWMPITKRVDIDKLEIHYLLVEYDKIGMDNTGNPENANAPILPYIQCEHCKEYFALLPVPITWNANHDIRHYSENAPLFLEHLLYKMKQFNMQAIRFHPAY